MKYDKLNGKEKGVIGLEVLLSIVAMLFVIGILVMAFTIAGSKLGEAVAENGSVAFTNTSLTNITEVNTLVSTTDGCALTLTDAHIVNDTLLVVIDPGNYTIAGCNLAFSGSAQMDEELFNSTSWNITGSYTYLVQGEAVRIINTTKVSLGDVVDWFGTYIVMASIVVIILLVVIIINAVKGGGLMGETRGA